MCGISRRPRRIFSNSLGASVRPSPPEMRTSRTCGRPAQVLELRLVVAAVEVLGGVAHDARPRAVPAVRGALGRDQHQDPVGVAVDEARDGRVAVLGERVLHHRGEGLVLPRARDDLPADRVVRVLRVHQADEVRRDVDAELLGRGQALALVVGQLEDLLDLLEVVDPVAQLPAPVVPLLVGDVRPQRGAAADRGSPVRPEDLGRVRAVDERDVAPRRARRPGGRRRTGSRGHPTLAGLRRRIGLRCIESMHRASRRMIARWSRPGPAHGRTRGGCRSGCGQERASRPGAAAVSRR